MTRRLLAVLVAGALAATPAALHAQLSTSFGVAGGIAVPTGDLANAANAGYNLAAHVNLGAPLMPIGIRLEGGFNSFDYKQTGFTTNGSERVISGTVNATLALGPSGASPYLIGGVGAYNRTVSSSGVSSSGETNAGFNVGGGLRFPLGTMSTFIEARYHKVLGNVDTQYVPITFGVNF